MNDNVKGFTNTSKINQEAAEWILLVEETDKLSDEQIKALNAWVAISDVHKQCLINMANSWGEMDLLSSVMMPKSIKNQSKVSLLFSGLFVALMSLLSLFISAIKSSTILLRPKIAASFAAVCIISLISFNALKTQNNTLLLSTKVGQQINHSMPDGTHLWLNSNTKIKVKYNKHNRKIQLLSGEAHFEVAKDPSRPFEVYTDNRLVTAIGTAFTVHKLEESIEIIVTEGTVELAIIKKELHVIPEEGGEVQLADNVNSNKSEGDSSHADTFKDTASGQKKTLGKFTAGQQISIPSLSDRLGDVVKLDTNDLSRHLSWKEGKLIFSGEPLEEVIKEITRHTEVKIDIVEPQLKGMRIGGQFPLGETDTLFYVLESGFGIHVSKVDENHIELRIKEATK